MRILIIFMWVFFLSAWWVWETPKIEKWQSSRQPETPIFPVCGHTGCACYSASHSGMASTVFCKCTYTCCACYSLKSQSPALLECVFYANTNTFFAVNLDPNACS